jgi:predicted transcriptional regulator
MEYIREIILKIRNNGGVMAVNTEEQVTQMRAMREAGKTLQEIGDAFGVTRERIRQIIGNTGQVREPKIADADVLAARQLYTQGEAIKALAGHYGISYIYMWQIITGKSRKDLLGQAARDVSQMEGEG